MSVDKEKAEQLEKLLTCLTMVQAEKEEDNHKQKQNLRGITSEVLRKSKSFFDRVIVRKSLVLAMIISLFVFASAPIQVLIAYSYTFRVPIYIVSSVAVVLYMIGRGADWYRWSLNVCFPFFVTTFFAQLSSLAYSMPYKEWLLEGTTNTGTMMMASFGYAVLLLATILLFPKLSKRMAVYLQKPRHVQQPEKT
ncbi:hypothetical protein [Pontibacillus yanchengensis]|uniref:Transmembrane protein n=1 Tax=Pontibacillus yanchengensis Y32 TaxID=1385514 RepID=A0A0A2TAS2_9BACI|nr:hypothetical protein [Pontibacillus yanchengensis]KGP72659.1 hypothetical protein N782_11300 [Pontibacillus yanchengensis Y32]